MSLKKKNKEGRRVVVRRHVINSSDAELKRKGNAELAVDDPVYQKHIEFIYEEMKRGRSLQQVHADLIIRDEYFTDKKAFAEALASAHKFGEAEMLKDREYTFLLHMEKYESIFQDSMYLKNEEGFPLDKKNEQDQKVIVTKMRDAMKALKSKEDLLGLHDKHTVIEITNQHAVVVNNSMSGQSSGLAGHDFDKLSIEELDEFCKLIEESRTVPIEGVQRLTIIQSKYVNNQMIKDESYINDIEFEEVIDDAVPKALREFKTEPEVKKEEKPDTQFDHLPPMERIKQKLLKAKYDEDVKAYREKHGLKDEDTPPERESTFKAL